MTATSVTRSAPRGNTFVAPTGPLSPQEQGKVLFRLGYSLGVCVTDAQAAGWLEAEASIARKDAHNG